MNFFKTVHFIFIFLSVGLCLPFTSQADSDANTNHQLQNTSVEVNVSKNYGVTQKIQKNVIDHTLKPRFEANWRYSNDRSILMGEFWLPLMQCAEESVLFCDIRLMGDDNENKEFNVGLGYREVLHDTMLGDGVAGAMLWFDRRFTDRDFQFNQVTLGGEWLGEQYDLRMNGYFPIDKKKSYLQANPNGSGQGFVGNQLLVNTEQVVVEEVLPGIDFEVGSQLNFMNDITDSTRFFVGGYHFEADIAEDITGVRTRIVSDVTSDFQIGVRFQHDDVRGSQTYVESTIRFPFGHKKKFKREGIWSRLDESPERDIDVVSNETVTVQGTNEPLLNARTGLEQNVIHVDNTAAGGGNGSIETPYNTLAAAEAAVTTNDLIYVHTGDGTTAGQNAGITLDDAGQMLAGSGTDLLYSSDRFKTLNGNNITGALVEATTAPIITNGAGNGVDITADDVYVTGITVDGATSIGISIANVDNVTIDNVESSNNTLSGIRVDANGSTLTQATFTNNTVNNNANGFSAIVAAGGNIGTIHFTNNTAKNNTTNGIYSLSNGVGSEITTANYTSNTLDGNNVGIYVLALSGGDVGTTNFTGNTSNNNTNYGIRADANGAGSTISTTNFTNNVADNNAIYGFYTRAISDGDIGTIDFVSNTATRNTSDGIRISAQAGSAISTANVTNNTLETNGGSGLYAIASGVGATITTANVTNNTSNGNTQNGFIAWGSTNGDIGTVNFNNNIANSNTVYGFWANASNDGDLGTTNFTSNTATSNGSTGYYVQALSGGDIGTTHFMSNIAKNNISEGFYMRASGAGSTITTADFTNNTAETNGGTGLYAMASGVGAIFTSVGISDNTLIGNGDIGLSVHALTDGDISQVDIEGNTITDNASYGIFINDDSAAGGIAADLGGGAFSSVGNNRVYDNTSDELRVDLDGGNLLAENNWWGVASGLPGAELVVEDASTADTTPFLTSDPE